VLLAVFPKSFVEGTVWENCNTSALSELGVLGPLAEVVGAVIFFDWLPGFEIVFVEI
jgi:hypothetical protein